MKILQVKVFIVFIYMLSKNNKILKPLLLTMFLIMLSEMSFSQSQSVCKEFRESMQRVF